MMWPQLQTIAEVAIARMVNSLPEGLFIALFAWTMLRLLPRQNSGTRFAVWLVALLGVAWLPFIGGVKNEHSRWSAGTMPPVVTLPGHWGFLLFVAWLVMSSFAMLRLAIGLWRLRELRRSCIAVNAAELHPALRTSVAELSSSSRAVTLATSERVHVPAAIGFFRPVIVIPVWALRELRPEELNIILLHEFAHLRRWDDWSNLLQKIVRALFLFHPAVWWIDRRLSLEREMACDDQVLAATGNPRGYAQCLIALLEKSVARRGWVMAQAAVHRVREASLRLTQILDAGRPNSMGVWKPALGLVSVVSLLCLGVVPGAPKFVAFEAEQRAIPSGDLRAAAPEQSQFSAATVIPAAMRASTLPAAEKMSQPRTRQAIKNHFDHPVEASIEPQSTPFDMVQARWRAAAVGSEAEANASAKETDVAAPETIVVVRTSQRVGPNSWVWSVSVWRLRWVIPSPGQAAGAPIASKT